ncbi:heavy metal translocating P-type ATPase [Azohydromonas lata]|uniref:P-type Zn(2+) transporter n=1 Tax=Azohydromonas lata TaxID=45677 RepID=A0ABU5IP51_9BURK|nr:heavy metal translocating P-type ATPase [Azohydromonas lata]MDZ5460665.1 heavy metal translocating P-type ATPase [Azohydromonas lata]
MSTDDKQTSSCSDAACGCGSAGAAAPVVTLQRRPRGTPAELPPPPGATLLRIPDMDCAVEEADIRRALAGVAGIRALRFQLTARTLAISAPAEVMPTALQAIGAAGYAATDVTPGRAGAGQAATGHAQAHSHDHAPGHAQEHGHDHGHGHGHDHGLQPGLVRLGAALALATVAEGLHLLGEGSTALRLLGMAVALGAIALAGVDTFRKGFKALLRLKLNINALMAVAVAGAFVIGQWPEAAMVMALYAIAELIEARSVDRARNAIQKLMALAPAEALVQQADGRWQAQPVEQVPLQARVRVRPGERIPLDGVVTAGQGTVDQASVTGESLPVDKRPGDALFAGTVNGTQELELRVMAAASDSTLARIIHAVEQAQSTRAPMQRLVDRFAAAYTPAVFALALGVALLAPTLLDWSWAQAVYRALVLLVIACPCALVISTPVTVVSALAAAARAGVLVKGGAYLEQARRLRAVALDKTGTLTAGRPRLVEQRVLAGDEALALRCAASLAGRSDHPVSQAIAAALADAPAGTPPLPVERFEALTGRGVQALVDGRALVLGNHGLVHERGLCDAALEAELQRHEAAGRTVALLADERQVLALFAVADTLRAESAEAVAALRAMGVVPVLLSGDNTATARAVAAEVGITEVQAPLLPEEKLRAIEALQQRLGPTAMAGDGINDAPALARADIGIAMGGAGTDIAMEAADVVVMNDDLRRLPALIRLSRRMTAVLWQNVALALGIKAVFLGFAVAGSATMWMAVFADMGASLLVVANGLRLLDGKGFTSRP